MAYFNAEAGDAANFQKEISNMMHGFGDNPNPNPATVVLVENIVLQQMRSLLQEAYNISIERGKKNITNYEIIYLMRKNAMKLKQLQDYQYKMDQIDKKTNNLSVTEDDIVFVETDPNQKQRRNHKDIIQELDEMGEVQRINIDTITQERRVRASKLTEFMTMEKYEAYHKARCSSFRSGHTFSKAFVKLERWLNPNKELKLTVLALEVLGFLAYETVAELVDAVYLIRQDAKKKPGDPFSKYEGGFYCNPGALQNAVYIKSGFEGFPAITVAEVREAIRRFYTPTVGMNGLFYRNMNSDLPTRFISF